MRIPLLLFLFIILTKIICAQHTTESPDHLCSRVCAGQEFRPSPISLPNTSNNRRSSGCLYTTQSEFAQLATTQLFQYLVNESDPFSCVYRNITSFNKTFSPQIFSNTNVNYISQQAVIYGRLFDGENDNGIYGLISYLSIASQMAQYYKNDITYTTTTWGNMESACVALANNPNSLAESLLSLRVVAEMMNTAAREPISSNGTILSFAGTLLSNIASGSYSSQTDYYNYYYCYYFLLDIYFRYSPSNEDFINELALQPEVIGSLGDIATDDELLNPTYTYFADLSAISVAALAKLANYPALHSDVTIELSRITDHYEKNTPQWAKAAIALTKNDLPFDMTYEEIINTLNASLFPHTYEFDDGRFNVSTPLPYEDVLALYQASQEVRSQFFRLLQDDEPVAGDTNDTLFIKLHGTRDSYREFNGILFGIDYPNSGGVYIESYATFYTYERTPEESTYTLEELFRHEYTHYLQGRYIIPGNWGASPIYDNSRMVWFEEGMAQFLAGSTISDGIKSLELIRDRINARGDVMDLNTVLNSNYASGNPDSYYIYGSMLWSEWYNQDHTRIKEMFDYLRNSDVSAFDMIVDLFKSDAVQNTDYVNYVNSSLTDDSKWILPQSELLLPEDISFSDINSLASDLSSADASLSVISSDVNVVTAPKRYTITADYQLSTPISDIDELRAALDMTLNSILTDVRSTSDNNSFDYSSGYFKNLVTGTAPSATFVFTGPINDACTAPKLADIQAESFSTYALLYAEDMAPLKHRFRYKEKTSNQWIELNESTFVPDAVINLNSMKGYDFQLQYECIEDVWSGYSESKDIYPCPDHSEIMVPSLNSDIRFSASKTIATNSIILPGIEVNFTAGQSMEFLPDFEVKKGANLLVNMNDCRKRQ